MFSGLYCLLLKYQVNGGLVQRSDSAIFEAKISIYTRHTYIVYNARVHKITSLGHYSDDIRWLQVELNVFKWPLVQMVHCRQYLLLFSHSLTRAIVSNASYICILLRRLLNGLSHFQKSPNKFALKAAGIE